jgi:hypothetical protein
MMPSELARSQTITTTTFDPVLLDSQLQPLHQCFRLQVTIPDDGTVDFLSIRNWHSANVTLPAKSQSLASRLPSTSITLTTATQTLGAAVVQISGRSAPMNGICLGGLSR